MYIAYSNQELELHLLHHLTSLLFVYDRANGYSSSSLVGYA